MRKRLTLACLAGILCFWVLCWLPGPAAGADGRYTPVWSDWRIVARADIILTGTLVAVEKPGSQEPPYTLLRLRNIRLLKSPDKQKAFSTVSLYSGERSRVRPEQLVGLQGKEVIIFAKKLGAGGIVCALEDYPGAVSSLSSLPLDAITQEIKQQAAIDRQLAEQPPAKDSADSLRAARLIEDLRGTAPSAEKAVTELLSSGRSLLPLLVRRLDDRREVTPFFILLPNTASWRPDPISAAHFESDYHYAPPYVMDALAAILTKITREDIGFIEDGATEARRRNVLRAWRVYVAYLTQGQEPTL